MALDGDGDTAVVGAKNNRVDGVNQAGSAYVFEHDCGRWIERAKLTASPPVAFGEFGAAVDISADGRTIIIGETFSGAATRAHFFRAEGDA